MANKINPIEEQDPEVVIESAISRTEMFFMKNGRSLLIALAVVVLVIGGFFGYKYLVEAPRAEKASAMIFFAEQKFAVDSFSTALNGDGNDAGFLQVIEKYGSTPQGNLAKHYAGICYMRLGDFQKALDYLKQYKAVEGIPSAIINAQNVGLQGDAYAQLEKYKEAMECYKKASELSDNQLTTPFYLKKYGILAEKNGDLKTALAAYKKIETQYASSMESRDIQKFIGRVEQQQ